MILEENIKKYHSDSYSNIEDYTAALHNSDWTDLVSEIDKIIESKDLRQIRDSISLMRKKKPKKILIKFHEMQSTCSDDFLATYEERRKAYIDFYEDQTKRLSDAYFSLAIS